MCTLNTVSYVKMTAFSEPTGQNMHKDSYSALENAVEKYAHPHPQRYAKYAPR